MNCKDCLHKCYTTDLDDGEICNFFIDKSKYVEVVRCMDCKHSEETESVFGITDYKCRKHNISCLSATDYCSYGERSET